VSRRVLVTGGGMVTVPDRPARRAVWTRRFARPQYDREQYDREQYDRKQYDREQRRFAEKIRAITKDDA